MSQRTLRKTQPVQIVWEQPADHANLLCYTNALIGQPTFRQLSSHRTSDEHLQEKGWRRVIVRTEVLREKGSKYIKKKASLVLLRIGIFSILGRDNSEFERLILYLKRHSPVLLKELKCITPFILYFRVLIKLLF